MSELRAPDPTLAEHPAFDEDGDLELLPVTGLGDSGVPVAHRPRYALCVTHPCRNVGWSPTPALSTHQAAYIAVPCRECFPGAPPPGWRHDPDATEGVDGLRLAADPRLAWQMTLGDRTIATETLDIMLTERANTP